MNKINVEDKKIKKTLGALYMECMECTVQIHCYVQYPYSIIKCTTHTNMQGLYLSKQVSLRKLPGNSHICTVKLLLTPSIFPAPTLIVGAGMKQRKKVKKEE